MVLSFATLFERTQRHQSQHVRRVVESVSIFSELHFNILRGDLPFRVLGRAGALLEALEEDTPVAGGPGTNRREAPAPQLDLFVWPKLPTCSEEDKAVLLQLANVELDRMTPLEALQLLSAMKRQLAEDG